MTTNVGDIYYEIRADVAPLLQGQQEADKALGTGLSKLTSAIKGVIAASALREMAEMVQKYQEMAERVQIATSSQAEFQMVQQRLLTIANGTYRSLQEAQELYIRTAIVCVTCSSHKSVAPKITKKTMCTLLRIKISIIRFQVCITH